MALAVVAALLLVAAAGAAVLWSKLAEMHVTPGALARYVEQRAAGHNPAIVTAGALIAGTLRAMTRGDRTVTIDDALLTTFVNGARSSAPRSAGRPVMVERPDDLARAIANAKPGDAITLRPGIYRLGGPAILVNQPGTKDAPIAVRAERPGTATLELTTVEGFRVMAPYWTFENLIIRGACRTHDACEHAFHVVDAADHFTARGNTIVDFNAHFKINAEGRRAPDHGLIEGNLLTNSSPRLTEQPVTPIDLVAASHWIVRRNVISDFAKAWGDEVSYGAYAKGGGEDNRFEQNMVICEHRVKDVGIRVGLSLGGGGTDPAYCRDGRCITEQEGSTIASNLIAACSDAGIYLRSAAGSSVLHNTLLDTSGIVVRFPESAADVLGNLVDSTIVDRDGAILREVDNEETGLARMYLGWNAVRHHFANASTLDLQWRSEAPRRRGAASGLPDLCGARRPDRPALGAFEDFEACRRSAP